MISSSPQDIKVKTSDKEQGGMVLEGHYGSE